MNLKSYRALQAENPEAAMIFDLTERFPRGPKGKLRRKDYTVDSWYEPKSKKLVGGSLGYDIFELYALASRGLWESDLAQIVTTVEGAAMGRVIYVRSPDAINGRAPCPKGTRRLFKEGPQITRRIRRLQGRLRQVKEQVEKTSAKNIYDVRVGNMNDSFACFGHDATEAQQVFNMLLQGAFQSASETQLFRGSRWGYGDEGKDIHTEVNYSGPAHGPHEILTKNAAFSEQMRKKANDLRASIKLMETQIEAAEDLAQLMDMFTMNTCAAFTEDV